jgi:precorrin isomerase
MTRGLSPGAIAADLEMSREEVVAIIEALRREYRTSCDIEVVVRGIHNGQLKTSELLW